MKILLFLFFLFTSLFALQVDYDKARELALQNNALLQQKILESQEATLQKSEVDAQKFGRVYLSEEFMRTNQASHVFASKLASREASFSDFGLGSYTNPSDLHVKPSDLNYPSSVQAFDTSIVYEVPLFTGFKLSSLEEIASLDVQAKKSFLSFYEMQLLHQVLLYYNKAVAAKYEIEAAKKSSEAIKQVSYLVSLNYKNGMATEVDTLTMKKRELEAASRYSNATNNYQIALSNLRFLCATKEIDDVDSFYIRAFNYEDLESLHVKAFEAREDLKAMQNLQDIAKKNVDLIKADDYPKINGFAKYGFYDSSLSSSSKKDYYMAGINIELNIFDAFKSSYAKEKEEVKYKKQAQVVQEYKNSIIKDIDESFYNIQNFLKIEKESEATLELNELLFEKTKLMYENQMISITELLEAEANLYNAKSRYIQARLNTIVSKSQLLLLIGNKDLKK